jgi:hypothetical protein
MDRWDWGLYRALEHQFAWEEMENLLTDGAYYRNIGELLEQQLDSEE